MTKCIASTTRRELLATSREVELCVPAYERLMAEGVRARVVSMPSWELWSRYVGEAGEVIGMHTFGVSAPLKALQTEFGFTPERIVQAARESMERAIRSGGDGGGEGRSGCS